MQKNVVWRQVDIIRVRYEPHHIVVGDHHSLW